jgi:adenosylcobinamide-phosphate synthase
MEAENYSALAILAGAVLLDCVFGEFPHFLHPVVWLGKVIAGLVRIAPARGWWLQIMYGTLLTCLICGTAGGAAWLVMNLSEELPIVHIGLGILLLKSSAALHALGQAGKHVCRPIEQGNLDESRKALRSLCSRDPSELDQEEILQATIESLAENASDSWVAPLFYFAMFGVPGAVCYRAINTLDAMIGYRGRFEALGKVAAHLDDLANWFPARLTAGLLLVSGWLGREDVAGGWRIQCRDGDNTPSPNGGRPMAAMAGLLDVSLDKKGVYSLGDARVPLTPAKVRQAWRIVVTAAVVMVVVCGILLT